MPPPPARLAVVEIEGQFAKRGGWKVSIATLVEGISKLISAKPTADRNLLLQGTVSTRAGLPRDDSEAPLRYLYLDGKDLVIYKAVTDYFDAVTKTFWGNASTRSFITRTVGILALFDILRCALLLKRVDVKDIKRTSTTLLAKASAIDFSDNYFHASGAGRVRIRKIMEYATELRNPAELGEDVVSEARRLLK